MHTRVVSLHRGCAHYRLARRWCTLQSSFLAQRWCIIQSSWPAISAQDHVRRPVLASGCNPGPHCCFAAHAECATTLACTPTTLLPGLLRPILPHSSSLQHDWRACPFAHPTENARRRDPREFKYSSLVCPDYRQGCCVRGDTCQYAHGEHYRAGLSLQHVAWQLCLLGMPPT